VKAVETINGERAFYSEAFYLEYLNDFITVKGIAEHYNVPESHASLLIDVGRSINHKKHEKARSKNLRN